MPRRILKCLVSVWLLYHLAVMFAVPNQFSFLTNHWAPCLIPYANLLGLHVNWDFFAPNPGSPITLEIKFDSPKGAQTAVFPDPAEPIFRPQLNRRIAMARLVPKRNSLLSEVFLPWLCRRYPEASVIGVTAKAGVLSSFKDVERGMPLNDFSRTTLVADGRMRCLQRVEEK